MAISSRDYLYLREIILGMRDGYIANNEKINELKKYITVKDCDYFLYTCSSDYGATLFIEVLDEIKKLELFKNKYKYVKEDRSGKIMLSYSLDGKKNYVTSNRMDLVSFTDDNTFFCKSDHLLLSDFVSKLKEDDEYNYIINEAEIEGFNIASNGIWVNLENWNSFAPGTSIFYSAKSDQIKVRPRAIYEYGLDVTQEGLQKVFDSKIPVDVINPYALKVIENSSNTDMPIIVDGYTTGNLGIQYFDFNEDTDNKVMVLKRKKY